MPISRPTAALDLPSRFRLVTSREVGDAFAHASAIAHDAGAGTLVYVGRFDVAEFAVVLEPEEPLHAARGVFYAGCTALVDALAVHAPPGTPIALEWPDTIHVGGRRVGGVRLGWPDGADESKPADWLVFGGVIRTIAMGEAEPGLRPLGAMREAERFDDADSGRLVESFARHLTMAIDAWREHGFRKAAQRYLLRLMPELDARREIDDNGDLLVRRTGGVAVERRALVPLLLRPSWLDPATGGLRR